MQTHKIGQGMIAVGFILAIVLLTGIFGNLLDHQRNPNSSPSSARLADGAAEVVLQRNRFGHYLVSGAINGADVLFLVDTGATEVVIPEGVARELNLRRGQRGRAMTANGPVTVYATTLASLDVGAIRLTNVRASINPGMSGEEILLGMSALRQVEFLQRGDTLTLRHFPP